MVGRGYVMNVGRGYVKNVGRGYVIQHHELINKVGIELLGQLITKYKTSILNSHAARFWTVSDIDASPPTVTMAFFRKTAKLKHLC